MMLTSIRGLSKTLKRRQKLAMSALDPLLDVEPVNFDRTVDKLVQLLDSKDVALSIDGPGPNGPVTADQGDVENRSVDPRAADRVEAPGRGDGSQRRGDWTRSYQQEVSSLPRLSRAGEFLMARRYAFAKARLAHALRFCGVPGETIDHILGSGRGVSGRDVALLDDAVLRKYPKCTAARRRRIRRCHAELEAVRNRYIEGALYIVLKSVHRYAGLGIDTSDLVQEGNASLFQAVDGFDWTRDVRFKTYAEYWINQAFLKMLYNNVRTVRIPVWVQKALKKINTLRNRTRHATGQELTSEQIGKALGMSADKVDELLRTNRYAVSIDADLPGEDGGRIGDLLAADHRSVSESIEDVSLIDRLGEVMSDLPDREKLILTLRFGLGGKNPYTLAQVGELLEISAERVRQLQEAALRRLQIPRKLRRLETFAS